LKKIIIRKKLFLEKKVVVKLEDEIIDNFLGGGKPTDTCSCGTSCTIFATCVCPTSWCPKK